MLNKKKRLVEQQAQITRRIQKETGVALPSADMIKSETDKISAHVIENIDLILSEIKEMILDLKDQNASSELIMVLNRLRAGGEWARVNWIYKLRTAKYELHAALAMDHTDINPKLSDIKAFVVLETDLLAMRYWANSDKQKVLKSEKGVGPLISKKKAGVRENLDNLETIFNDQVLQNVIDGKMSISEAIKFGLKSMLPIGSQLELGLLSTGGVSSLMNKQ